MTIQLVAMFRSNLAAIHFVRVGQQAGFVVEFDNQVFAKVRERAFGTETRAVVPDLVGPLLEVLIVGYAALELDRLEIGFTGRLPRGAGIAAFAVLHNLGGALECAHFVKAICVYAKFCHGSSSP